MFSRYAHHNSGGEGKEENSSLISARYPWGFEPVGLSRLGMKEKKCE